MATPSAKQKLQEIQTFETLVVPNVSTNVNKTLKAGKNTVTGIADVGLELEDGMVIATFTSRNGLHKPVVIGIPLSFIRTLVFA